MRLWKKLLAIAEDNHDEAVKRTDDSPVELADSFLEVSSHQWRPEPASISFAFFISLFTAS